jgi:hypothetical protein
LAGRDKPGTSGAETHTRLAKLDEEAKSFWVSKKLKKTLSESRKCPTTKHQ